MIGNEFGRVNIEIDWGTGLDTLRATGCKLAVACAEYGIVLDGAHRALFDARATGRLLFAVADAFSRACFPVAAKPLRHTLPRRVLTRDGVTEINVDTPYLASLARGVHADVDIASYAILLDRAIADLQLTGEERHELAELATELGLDDQGRERAHREFLDGMIDAALEDGVVTEDELDQLCRAAALLELDANLVTRRTNPYRLVPEPIALEAGLVVCFTGAALDDFGNQIDRESVLEVEAQQHGLLPIDQFRKACGLVIAADTASESKKVREARRLGVPVASVADYRTALRTGRPVIATKAVSNGVALVCTECGASWMAMRRSSKPVCTSCRGGSTPRVSGPDESSVVISMKPVVSQQPPAIQTLECSQCNRTWERPRSRGRRPLRCPTCAATETASAHQD
ncbi:MAG: hypothetical protein EKK51_06925 [Mycolicibacterium sp.]|nr:MAG: hypothetical protein EKK51_06925 [Mycolicibacterium sp.]